MGVSQDIDTLAVETFDKNAHVLMGVSNETQFEVSASGENMFTDNALLLHSRGFLSLFRTKTRKARGNMFSQGSAMTKC